MTRPPRPPPLLAAVPSRRAGQQRPVPCARHGVGARVADRPVDHPDPRLRERHFGEWQGALLTDIEAKHPAEYARWRAGDPSPGCGIESLDDLAKRVVEALQDAADLAPGGTVVVTTHGGAARQGCGALLGWPNEATRTLGSLHNCHWTELTDRTRRVGGTGWQLMAHNVGVLGQS